MTFSTIQTLSNGTAYAPVANFDSVGHDDVSVAKRIAANYEQAGIDPAAAYDDPESALSELGLKDYGF